MSVLLWSVIRSLSDQQSKTSSSRVWTVGWVVSSFTKLYPGVWTLEASSTHSPLATASVVTFEISVIRLTRCREWPNCATRWTMRRRKYDFMRGSIVVTRLSACHWTCAESFRFISCWFDGEKNLPQRKNFDWQRKFSSWFQISRKVSSNGRLECAAKILAENAGDHLKSAFKYHFICSVHHISQRERVDTCVVFDQVFDDFEVSVKAGGSQGSWVCLCRWVNVRPTLHQQADYFQVACRNMVRLTTSSSINIRRNMEMITSSIDKSPKWLPSAPTCRSSTPEWGSSLYRFPVKGDTASLLRRCWRWKKVFQKKKNLLDGGATPIHQIFHHLVMTIPVRASKSGSGFRKRQKFCKVWPAWEDKWGCPVGLGCHQPLNFLPGTVVQKHLKRWNLRLFHLDDMYRHSTKPLPLPS